MYTNFKYTYSTATALYVMYVALYQFSPFSTRINIILKKKKNIYDEKVPNAWFGMYSEVLSKLIIRIYM